jgi:hypothetical protein
MNDQLIAWVNIPSHPKHAIPSSKRRRGAGAGAFDNVAGCARKDTTCREGAIGLCQRVHSAGAQVWCLCVCGKPRVDIFERVRQHLNTQTMCTQLAVTVINASVHHWGERHSCTIHSCVSRCATLCGHLSQRCACGGRGCTLPMACLLHTKWGKRFEKHTSVTVSGSARACGNTWSRCKPVNDRAGMHACMHNL